ncbi:endo-1,4-beta-xylanase [Cellulomonas sp. ACRRI]|uniref:endo-1,4-beta-xylanase n=1 Tax=Cellulomonas sp. ACRRI TaxID=2918188 RepID=UPI001EF168EB|nr:endo-1,4-beta-xylanase [Cellulomonas sp. ACRRI]MCG7287918.1 endo-1,4-beta-xylanase [Cellulomonas sp. ACRRI]
MRRPALLIGTGAVVLVLVLLAVVLATPGGDENQGPTPTAAASTPPAEAMTTVLSSTFDEGDEGWTPLGEGVQVSDAQGTTHDGAGSLLVSGRSEAWHGAAVDLSGSVARGQVHTVSAWVRLGEGAGDADVQLTLERDPGSDDPLYLHVARGAATAGDWVELVGTAQVPEGDGEWRLYVETTESTADLRLDDVTVQRPTPEVQTDVTALKDATEVPLGVAVGPQDLTGRPAELLLRHFDQITPENAMKPVTVQPTEGEFDFGPMDEVLDFAAAHGLTVHGHTLVWHRSTPEWFFEAADGRPLTDSAADRALLLDRLRSHTRAIADHLAERYGDASPVTSWDVVNEALDPEQPDGLRHSRWYEVLGPGYVAEAFRIAREELGPDVTLYLNDYDTDAPDRRRGLVRLVLDLQAAGAPVDAVGHQMHVDLDTDVDRVATTLDAVAGLGLRQAVTELDVAISGRDEQLDRTPADRLETQRGQVRDLAAAFAQRDLAFIGVWGLYDTRSWLRAWPQERPYEAPLLFDDDLQAKPAYEGFLEGLGAGAG